MISIKLFCKKYFQNAKYYIQQYCLCMTVKQQWNTSSKTVILDSCMLSVFLYAWYKELMFAPLIAMRFRYNMTYMANSVILSLAINVMINTLKEIIKTFFTKKMLKAIYLYWFRTGASKKNNSLKSHQNKSTTRYRNSSYLLSNRKLLLNKTCFYCGFAISTSFAWNQPTLCFIF